MSGEQAPSLSESSRFSILCVCTGNICRSPVAERLLADRLGDSIRVWSAGTHPVPDAPMSPEMAALMRAAGHQVSLSTSRRLMASEVVSADLVLTMERIHRSAVVELVPAAVRRTFMLREFARLMRDQELPLMTADVAERLRQCVAVVAGQRSSPVVSDDIVDPYRQGEEVYRQAFDAIDGAVNDICAALLPTSSGQGYRGEARMADGRPV